VVVKAVTIFDFNEFYGSKIDCNFTRVMRQFHAPCGSTILDNEQRLAVWFLFNVVSKSSRQMAATPLLRPRVI
jgi:hypothetical protein